VAQGRVPRLTDRRGDRHAGRPAGIAVFRIAFERWVDETNDRDFPGLVHDSLDQLKALTAGEGPRLDRRGVHSVADQRQVELGEPFGVGEEVDLDDLPVPDGEGAH
jgi:hypothetical protein